MLRLAKTVSSDLDPQHSAMISAKGSFGFKKMHYGQRLVLYVGPDCRKSILHLVLDRIIAATDPHARFQRLRRYLVTSDRRVTHPTPGRRQARCADATCCGVFGYSSHEPSDPRRSCGHSFGGDSSLWRQYLAQIWLRFRRLRDLHSADILTTISKYRDSSDSSTVGARIRPMLIQALCEVSGFTLWHSG